jgi:peptidoglycan-N-acetylglucosamine deacetylase
MIIVKSEVLMFCVVKLKSIRYVLLVVLCAVLLAISFNGVASAQVFFGYPNKLVPVYCVDTNEKQVAISFDAAWGADKTEKIMDILKEYNVTATFFLVGFWVDKYPELVKKIDANGFEIGTHSNTHPDMTKLSKESAKLELTTCVDMIEKLTEKKVELFRPPYGAYNNTVIDVAKELNLIPIQWSVDSLDWKGLSAKDITTRIINGAKCGAIILCHNNSDYIVEALPMVLDRLKAKGYKVTSVGELVYKQNYEIDRNGVQKLKS